MQDPQSAPGSRVGKRAGGNGRSGIPLEPVDRSHLLKRSNSFPFPLPHDNGLVRIRRERRVCESFCGIRSLARRGRQGHR